MLPRGTFQVTWWQSGHHGQRVSHHRLGAQSWRLISLRPGPSRERRAGWRVAEKYPARSLSTW